MDTAGRLPMACLDVVTMAADEPDWDGAVFLHLTRNAVPMQKHAHPLALADSSHDDLCKARCRQASKQKEVC